MKTLGGWRRLWLLLAALYLVVVGFFVWQTMPTAPSTPHSFDFYSAMSPATRAPILNAQVNATKEMDFVRDAANAKDAQLVEMPNGHTLVFRRGLANSDMTASSKAYWATVKQSAVHAGIQHVLWGLVWWVLPLTLLYALGLAFRWVYRGFKRSPAELPR
jgi:hypothetical protein